MARFMMTCSICPASALHQVQAGGGNDVHIHRFRAHQMTQHSVHAGEHPVQVEGFRPQELLAAIGQQLPGQRGGAIGGLG